MPVRIRLVTPISMGRKSQVIAQKGVVAHRERAAEREFGDCGFDSRLRKPRSAAALVHRVFLTGRRGWIIGKSGRKTASGFKSRTTGRPVDVPFSPLVRHFSFVSVFDGSQDWVIAYEARGRRFESGLRLQMPE